MLGSDRQHRPRPIVAAAVVATLMATVTGNPAAAELAAASPNAGGTLAPATSGIYPTPQSVTAGKPLQLRGKVAIAAGADSDPIAVGQVTQLLKAQGLRLVPNSNGPYGPNAVVYIGTKADNPAIGSVLDQIGVTAGAELTTPEGYLLATGRTGTKHIVVLAGADRVGTFYAAQSFRQILAPNGQVKPLIVRDWPAMPIRGAVEGFYGFPWSHQARLDQLVFYGQQKMNTYIYTPKDDPLLRRKWRELYTGDQLAQLSELVNTATANHVEFTYALSPGNDICYSSQADLDATNAKFQSLYDLGVRSFYIALDDIPLELHCDADKEMFTKGNWGWLADAQAYYLNRVNSSFIKTHVDVRALQMVPTNYSGSAADPYKTELGIELDQDILLQWTGEQVVSHRITTASANRARTTYGTATDPRDIYIWDNYPVNDFAQDRLFLAPLIGRDADLDTAIEGITANPMIQPYASLPALFNFADYTWNTAGYEPQRSMTAALALLAGPEPAVQRALNAFVDLNQNWQNDVLTPNAPALTADVEAFWRATSNGQPGSATALATRAKLLTSLPATLAGMAEPGFVADAVHWIDAAAAYGLAFRHAIAMLDAVDADNGPVVVKEYVALAAALVAAKEPTQPTLDQGKLTPKVGDGVADAFLSKAKTKAAEWLGSGGAGDVQPTSTMSTYQSYLPARMLDGDPGTYFWTSEPPAVGDAIGVDLGAVTTVSAVKIQQADSDTVAGDMFYRARVEYSTDGTTWTTAGTFEAKPLITVTFGQPITARFVRMVAIATNPGGQWVKVREFDVTTPKTLITSTIPAATGSQLDFAADGKLDTAWQASRKPSSRDAVTLTLTKPQTGGTVTIVGTAAGNVQVQRNGTWITVGRLASSGFNRLDMGPHPATAVRLAFTADGTAPRITEIIVR